MAIYQVRVQACSEEGDIFLVYKCKIMANDPAHAEKKAMNEGWDKRLDRASCAPHVRVRKIRKLQAKSELTIG